MSYNKEAKPAGGGKGRREDRQGEVGRGGEGVGTVGEGGWMGRRWRRAHGVHWFAGQA